MSVEAADTPLEVVDLTLDSLTFFVDGLDQEGGGAEEVVVCEDVRRDGVGGGAYNVVDALDLAAVEPVFDTSVGVVE